MRKFFLPVGGYGDQERASAGFIYESVSDKAFLPPHL